MPRMLSIALASCLASACTSEAKLGSWSKSGSAPLSGSDAANQSPLEPGAPRGGASSLDPPPVSDAAMPDDSDVGVHIRSPLCLRNPSLDGIPYAGPLAPDSWWPPEAWDLCWYATEDYPADMPETGPRISAVTTVNDTTTIDAKDGSMAIAGGLPVPTHGVAYLQLDTLLGMPERTSQTMCVTLEAGVTYNFAIDLATRAGQTYDGATIQSGVLEIYGSNTPCGHDGEPLWRSPPLTAQWQTYCVSLTPHADASIITLQVAATQGSPTAVLVDNIRLDPSCGPSVVEPSE